MFKFFTTRLSSYNLKRIMIIFVDVQKVVAPSDGENGNYFSTNLYIFLLVSQMVTINSQITVVMVKFRGP